MKEIVVISGKGGTGKTSITASFAVLGGHEVVVADCDVDAADMHLLLSPDFKHSYDFYSGEQAYIDQSCCNSCGDCARVCRFDAISLRNGLFIIDPLSCEGCGFCARICPEKAIVNKKRLAGQYYISTFKTGSHLVHARLGIGADNSGKLVAKVKDEARKIAAEKHVKYILVDGSPGVGCPVVSSLSGASFVVLVTEPSVSGLHDLKRVYKLVKKFNIKAGCIINKADVNPGICTDIIHYLEEEDIVHLTDLSYNEDFIRAMVLGQTIVEFDHGNLKELLTVNWEKIKHLVTNTNHE